MQKSCVEAVRNRWTILVRETRAITKTKWNHIIIWYHLLSIPPTIEAIYKVAWSVSSDPPFKAHFRIPAAFPRSWQTANNSKDRRLRVEMGIEDDGKRQQKEGSRTLPKTETWPPEVQREIGWGTVMYGSLQNKSERNKRWHRNGTQGILCCPGRPPRAAQSLPSGS